MGNNQLLVPNRGIMNNRHLDTKVIYFLGFFNSFTFGLIILTKVAANTPRPLHACFPTFGGWEREKPLVTQTWVNYVALGQCKTIFRSSSLPASRQTRRSKSENSLACIHTKVVGTIFYNFMASQNKRHETAFLYTYRLLRVLTNKQVFTFQV